MNDRWTPDPLFRWGDNTPTESSEPVQMEQFVAPSPLAGQNLTTTQEVIAGPLSGSEVTRIVQGGANAQTTLQQIANLAFTNVKSFGAVGDGVHDDTSAIQAATRSNTATLFPAGTYKVTNLAISGVTNFAWIGIGVGGVSIISSATGAAVTFSGCNFGSVDGFSFKPSTAPAGAIGLLINLGTGNIEIRRCIFQNWPSSGMQIVGTSGAQLSGNKIYDSYFLQNAAGAASVGQLDCTWCNDFFFANNQFGGQASAPFSTYGVQLTNSSNGGYYNNYAWQNNVGANFASSAYNRIWGSRFEQSQNEGAIFNLCVADKVFGNWINDNGLATVNTYNQVRLIACQDLTFEDNTAYDFTNTNYAKYSFSVESGCLRTALRGNLADKYSTGAWSFDTNESLSTLTTDGVLSFSSGATVAAGTTTYLGQGTSTATEASTRQINSARHTVVQLVAVSSNAPGAGQSFTYTLFKTGLTTGVSVTISGSSFGAVTDLATVIEDIPNNAQYSVQLVTSAAAVASNHWVNVVYCER